VSVVRRAYIGLGSNLEDPSSQLRRAVTALSQLPSSTPGPVSPVYRSSPMGPADQPDYLNAVMALDTSLEPLALLDALQAIEQAHHRRRALRWGPRTLDLDLLLYADQVLDLPRLQVPHPGVHEREFVIYPLADIAPDLFIPGRATVRDLLPGVDVSGLSRIDDFSWTDQPTAGMS